MQAIRKVSSAAAPFACPQCTYGSAGCAALAALNPNAYADPNRLQLYAECAPLRASSDADLDVLTAQMMRITNAERAAAAAAPCDTDTRTRATAADHAGGRAIPAGWTVHVDAATGASYYAHAASGVSQWTWPAVAEAEAEPTRLVGGAAASDAPAVRAVPQPSPAAHDSAYYYSHHTLAAHTPVAQTLAGHDSPYYGSSSLVQTPLAQTPLAQTRVANSVMQIAPTPAARRTAGPLRTSSANAMEVGELGRKGWLLKRAKFLQDYRSEN